MSSGGSLKQKVFIGFIWSFSEKLGAKLVGFVVSVILARLLAPDDFGLIAIVMVFIMLGNTIVNSGFGNALVQKESADNLDFSSVFYFTTAFSVVLYILLYFAAPSIANFYNNPQITPILRWMNIRLLLSGIGTAQSSYAYRNMQFQRFFWSSSAATTISAIVALTMAYAGYGVWALVPRALFFTIL